MAPFPETEIMTIKRLEVALRKTDFKLLKDGAYKLHEKLHSGHKFEYLDLLKEIYYNVNNTPNVPNEIRDILIPTIEDIISIKKESPAAAPQQQPMQETNQNRVSSLTSLAYNTNKEEHRISAFETFSAPRAQNIQEQTHSAYTQSSFSAQPFGEIPPMNQINTIDTIEQPQIQEAETSRILLDLKTEAKSVALLYAEDSSIEKTRNINKYREMVSRIKDNSNVSLNEILDLISEINTQSNTSIFELKSILDQLKNRENKVSFVTNSQSANLIGLLNTSEISYSLFDSEVQKRINILPLFGLTNLFRCSECHKEYLDTQEDFVPLVLQCPKCKRPMFADLYSQDNNLDITCYNSSLLAFATAKVWFLIHPLMNDRTIINLLTSALKLNHQLEDIFILEKDINIRDSYRNLFLDINPNIRINTQNNLVPDFFRTIDAQ